MISLTVIVPALNEEKKISTTVNGLVSYLEAKSVDYEILIFDDGSTDSTPDIADKLSKKNLQIRTVHNLVNQGLGYNYKKGVELSLKEYVIMIPADGENSLDNILEYAGVQDIIIPYVVNSNVRPFLRRVLSGVYTFLVNILSGLRLKYYNGTTLHKTAVVKRVMPYVSDGFGYQAEILVRLIKEGRTYKETGVYLQLKPEGGSKAFKLKNIIRVVKTLLKIFLMRINLCR